MKEKLTLRLYEGFAWSSQKMTSLNLKRWLVRKVKRPVGTGVYGQTYTSRTKTHTAAQLSISVRASLTLWELESARKRSLRMELRQLLMSAQVQLQLGPDIRA